MRPLVLFLVVVPACSGGSPILGVDETDADEAADVPLDPDVPQLDASSSGSTPDSSWRDVSSESPRPDARPLGDSGAPEPAVRDGSSDDATPDGGPDGPAEDPVDRASCTGPATVTGTVSGVNVTAVGGLVTTDPSSRGLRVILVSDWNLAAGALTVGIYFTPIGGQLSYPPNGAMACAVVRSTGTGWSVVDKTQLCEVQLSVIQHASKPGVCDGTIAGIFRGVFSGNQVLAGAFRLPSKIAASELREPSCRPRDASCSSHDQCCSGSCWMIMGRCH